LAASLDYQFEDFNADGDITRPPDTATHLLSANLRYFHASGFFGEVRTTYVKQDVAIPGLDGAAQFFLDDDADQFVLLDTAIGYRLPRRRGLIVFGVQNVFDTDFKFQGPSLRTFRQEANPMFTPRRTIATRMIVAF
jgi:hypothetical protein